MRPIVSAKGHVAALSCIYQLYTADAVTVVATATHIYVAVLAVAVYLLTVLLSKL